MKNTLTILLVLMGISINAEPRRDASENVWQVKSPDGSTQVTMSLDAGRLTYSAGCLSQDKKKGEVYTELLEQSPLGLTLQMSEQDGKSKKIVTRQWDLSTGVEPAGEALMEPVTAEYTLRTSKKANIKEQYTRCLLPLKAGRRKYSVEMWVGSGKVAFRYVVPQQGETAAVLVTEEQTGFNLPNEATAFICPQSDPMIGWKRTKPSYEEEYVLDAPMAQASKYGHGYTFPCLFRVGDKGWVEISETGTTGDYAACHLSEGNAEGLYTIAFPMELENNGFGSTTAQMGLPAATPWRTLTLAKTLAPIVESTVTWDVVEPLYEPTVEYKGGRGTWSWIIWQDESIVYKDQVAYVDLAAALGWEYCLVDAGWLTNIGRERMEEFFDYCRSKNVRPWIWYNSNGGWNDAPQCARQFMSNPITRKKEMAWLQKGSVAGIKVDFFGGDKQETMRLYEAILSDANDYGIQVIFHGCTLPRGWERMYPNYCSSEAVLASENLVFNQYWDDKEGENACLHPFIRNSVGSMEFGGTVLQQRLTRSNKGGQKRIVGDIFEIATAIAFQSSVQNFALTPLNLDETVTPKFEIDFMKDVPTEWTDTRYIDGYPGKYVVLARQSAQGKWYVAVMNAEKSAKVLTLDLKSLDGAPAEWQMLTDGPRGGEPTTGIAKADKKGLVKLTVGPQSGVVLY